jgi:hypothetical protein
VINAGTSIDLSDIEQSQLEQERQERQLKKDQKKKEKKSKSKSKTKRKKSSDRKGKGKKANDEPDEAEAQLIETKQTSPIKAMQRAVDGRRRKSYIFPIEEAAHMYAATADTLHTHS